jgi:hypothetical protein
VLEHVEARNEVERVVLEREPVEAGLVDVVPARAGRGHRGGADVRAGDLSEVRQAVENRARAAARVQDARVVPEPEALDLLDDYAQAAAIPPVALVVVEDGLELARLDASRLAPAPLAQRLVRLDSG